MERKRRSKARVLAALWLALDATSAAPGVLPAGRAPEVAALEMRNPRLDIRDAYRPISALPRDLAAAARRDLATLGAPPDGGRLDLRTGRWGMLLLAQPLLPGDGKGNPWRWPGGVAPSAPALQARAWEAFTSFLVAHAGELRVDPAQMPSPGHVTVHEDGALVQIVAPRVVAGIPVRDSQVSAVISHGNLVLLGATHWGDLGGAPRTPALGAAAAAAVAEGHIAPLAAGAPWRRPLLVLVPLVRDLGAGQAEPGDGLEYRLAWAVHPTIAGDVGRWEALVDAANGELLAFADTNRYASRREVKGGVYPVANDGMPPDGVEHPGWPMPFDTVVTPVGPVIADTGGNLPDPVAGTISSSLAGAFVAIDDACGAISLSSEGDLDFGASEGVDCATPGFGGPGNTHAARTSFYELNRMKEQARGQLPGNTWLGARLTAKTNLQLTCAGFWNGTEVSFSRSGGGCANPGEQAAVLDHEWGHGMDDNDANPSISRPAEGIADVYSALRLLQSCIGRGFLPGNCGGYGDPCIACSGVRDIDYARRLSGQPHDLAWIDANCRVGDAPCGGLDHCEGAVYSEAVWDLYARTLQAPPYDFDSNTALEATARLTYLGAGAVGTWYQCTPPYGGCSATGGYLNFLAADDDNGDLTDGTPHMTAIFNAFDAHQIACDAPSVRPARCDGAPVARGMVAASRSER